MRTLRELLIKNLANDKKVEIYLNYSHKNELSLLASGTSGDLMKVLSQTFQNMEISKIKYVESSVLVIIKVGETNAHF